MQRPPGGDLPKRRDGRKDPVGVVDMRAHDVPFLRGEPGRFFEDLGRDGELSEIVQIRGDLEHPPLPRGESRQARKRLPARRDAARVRRGERALEIDDPADQAGEGEQPLEVHRDLALPQAFLQRRFRGPRCDVEPDVIPLGDPLHRLDVLGDEQIPFPLPDGLADAFHLA